MVKLTRDQRREANERLLDLEEAIKDNEEIDFQDFHRQIGAVEGLLGSYGVAPESEYYKRLNCLRESVENLRRKRENVSYVGSFDKCFVVISGLLTISQHYLGKQKRDSSTEVSWRFNRQGRIGAVSAYLIPESETCPIITLKEREQEDDWMSAVFVTEPLNEHLHERINDISKKFFYKSDWEKYLSLVWFGHSNANNILRNLEKRKIKDPYQLNDFQRPLRQIVKNPGMMRILECASLIIPHIHKINNRENELVLEYLRRSYSVRF